MVAAVMAAINEGYVGGPVLEKVVEAVDRAWTPGMSGQGAPEVQQW